MEINWAGLCLLIYLFIFLIREKNGAALTHITEIKMNAFFKIIQVLFIFSQIKCKNKINLGDL